MSNDKNTRRETSPVKTLRGTTPAAGGGKPPPFVVKGAVRRADGTPCAGARVRAFDRDLREEKFLGESTADPSGHYEIAYTPDRLLHPDKGISNVQARTFDPKNPGVLLAESPVHFQAGAVEIVDLTIEPKELSGKSEIEILSALIAPAVKKGRWADLTESDVRFLTGETRVPAERIAGLAAAQKAAEQTGFPADAFFALQRAGLPVDPIALYERPPLALKTALENAAKNNVIPARDDASLAALRRRLEDLILESAVAREMNGGPSSLGAVLAAVDDRAEARRIFLSRYLKYRREEPSADPDAFWRGLASEPGLDPAGVENFRFAVQAGRVVRNDAAVVSRLQALRRNGTIFSALDLTLWSEGQWLSLLRPAWAGGEAAIPSWVEGDGLDTKRTSASAAMAKQAGKVFPAKNAAHVLVVGRVAAPSGRAAAGVRVQVFHCGLASDAPVCAPVTTDEAGRYCAVVDPFLLPSKIASTRPASSGKPGAFHLQVRAFSAKDNAELARSEVRFGASLPAEINLTAVREIGPTEFEDISERVRAAAPGLSPAALQDEKTQQWLAGATGLGLETVRRFAAAQQLAVGTPGLSAEAHYALLRPVSSKESKVPPSGAAEKLKAAAAAGLVSPSAADAAPAAEAWTKERDLRAKADDLKDSLVLSPAFAAARLPEETVKAYARALAEDPDAGPDAVDSRLKEAGVSVRDRTAVRRTQRLASLAGTDELLIGRLLKELPAVDGGRTDVPLEEEDERALRALAGRSAGDWQRVLSDAAAGTSPADLREIARGLEASFEKAYPREALLGRLAARTTPDSTRLRNFLESFPDVDPHGRGLAFQLRDKTPLSGERSRPAILEFLRSRMPSDDAGRLAEEARQLEEKLGSLQRLLRVTSASRSLSLLEQGFTSARGIAAMSRESFIQNMVKSVNPTDAQELSTLKNEAAGIHSRAVKRHGTALALAASFSPQLQGASPAACPGSGRRPEGAKGPPGPRPGAARSPAPPAPTWKPSSAPRAPAWSLRANRSWAWEPTWWTCWSSSTRAARASTRKTRSWSAAPTSPRSSFPAPTPRPACPSSTWSLSCLSKPPRRSRGNPGGKRKTGRPAPGTSPSFRRTHWRGRTNREGNYWIPRAVSFRPASLTPKRRGPRTNWPACPNT